MVISSKHEEGDRALRKADFYYVPVVASELSPGDVIRSKAGLTYRTVVTMTDQDVVARGSSGVVDIMPFSTIEEAWLKAIPLKPVVADELAPGDQLRSKDGCSLWTVASVVDGYVVLESEQGRARVRTFAAIEKSWYRVPPES